MCKSRSPTLYVIDELSEAAAPLKAKSAFAGIRLGLYHYVIVNCRVCRDDFCLSVYRIFLMVGRHPYVLRCARNRLLSAVLNVWIWCVWHAHARYPC